MERNTLTIIGSGNVATHLAKTYFAKGYTIVQIYSRTLAHAQALAQEVQATSTDNLQQLLPADMYLIAVSDSAIREVADQLSAGNALVAHTSGSTNIDLLNRFRQYGVLYPLQTFSTSRTITNWESIPVFIEANNSESLEKLRKWAAVLSPKVLDITSKERLQLHTAAVFACNFVNYLLGAAADLSGNYFPELHPLVRETIEKAFASGCPKTVQTGPASRNDTTTMEKQTALLSPALRKLYEEFSTLILEKQHKKHE